MVGNNPPKEKIPKNKENQSPINQQGDKVEFLVKFEKEIKSYFFFTKEKEVTAGHFFIDKNHAIFQKIKPTSGSKYYLKIIKKPKGEVFYTKNDFVELRKK